MQEQRHPMEHHPMEHHHREHHPHAHRHMDHRHHELHRRLMPYIERAHMTHRDIGHMSSAELHVLADHVMHDSGVLHHMPPGQTEASMRDLILILLLSMDDDSMPVDGMDAVETFNPVIPLALGPWFWPYYGWGGPWFGPGRRFRRGGFRGGHGSGRGGHRGRR